jgi:hypothetical protein
MWPVITPPIDPMIGRIPMKPTIEAMSETIDSAFVFGCAP